MNLSANALEILKKRYLLKDAKGRVIENPSQMFRRVAKAVAFADRRHKGDIRGLEEEFYKVMTDLEFLRFLLMMNTSPRSTRTKDGVSTDSLLERFRSHGSMNPEGPVERKPSQRGRL